jgi:hypothetical protein
MTGGWRSAMNSYRKKPIVIEAIRINSKNLMEIISVLEKAGSLAKVAWVDSFSDKCGDSPPYIEIGINTLEGTITARHGDFIIRGVRGEFYSCRSDVFEETYDEVD